MTIVSDETTNLWTLMREGSMLEHTEAENQSFISLLLKGEINEAGYARYLPQLRPVYAAIEEIAVELAGDPIASAVIDPALHRLATLDADLAYWAPDGHDATLLPSTRAYVDRVLASAQWGGLYVAHHYTRYLGDLSGGQAIGKILGRAWGITDGSGLSFYEFEQIPKPKLYKDGYRAALDAIDVTADEKQRVVTEVKAAFGLNSAIFAELSGDLDAFRR